LPQPAQVKVTGRRWIFRLRRIGVGAGIAGVLIPENLDDLPILVRRHTWTVRSFTLIYRCFTCVFTRVR
jgi:hypothetical protein